MRLKPMALSGAAIVALAGMIGASTSFAQTNTAPSSNAPAQAQSAPSDSTDTSATTQPVMHVRHHMRHHAQMASESTPAERRATADLNRQQLAQTEAQSAGNTQTAANGAANGQNAQTAMNAAPSSASSGAAQDESAQTAANTAPSTASSGAAQDQSAQTAMNGSDQKTAQSSNASTSAANNAGKVSLNAVRNPKRTLTAAKVENASGQQLGQVKNVTLGSDGKPQSVNVSLQSSGGTPAKTVTVSADQLTYDQDNNVLVTPLSQDQMNALPNPM